MNRSLPIIAVFILAGNVSLLPPVLAAGPPPMAPASTGQNNDQTNTCGFGTIQDWRPIDRHTLIVWLDGRKDSNARVLELDQACQAIKFTDSIAFKTMDKFHICSYGGDAIIADGQLCTIRRIRTYNPEKDKILGGKKNTRKDDASPGFAS